MFSLDWLFRWRWATSGQPKCNDRCQSAMGTMTRSELCGEWVKREVKGRYVSWASEISGQKPPRHTSDYKSRVSMWHLNMISVWQLSQCDVTTWWKKTRSLQRKFHCVFIEKQTIGSRTDLLRNSLVSTSKLYKRIFLSIMRNQWFRLRVNAHIHRHHALMRSIYGVVISFDV